MLSFIKEIHSSFTVLGQLRVTTEKLQEMQIHKLKSHLKTFPLSQLQGTVRVKKYGVAAAKWHFREAKQNIVLSLHNSFSLKNKTKRNFCYFKQRKSHQYLWRNTNLRLNKSKLKKLEIISS